MVLRKPFKFNEFQRKGTEPLLKLPMKYSYDVWIALCELQFTYLLKKKNALFISQSFTIKCNFFIANLISFAHIF